jgi:hypothetical protein
MRAVIPVGKGRPSSLPYALRALEEYAGVTEVWTVGQRPDGVTPDHHIDSPNNRRPLYFNTLGHLRAALADMDGAPFVWTADDIYPMAPWAPAVYARKQTLAGHLRDYPNRGNYTTAVKASVALVERMGHDPELTWCGAVHRPWLVEPERARRITDAVWEQGAGEWKMVYVAGLEDVVPVGDPKIFGHGMPQPGADMISTEVQSWRRNAGRLVRERFTTPSRWEP